MIQNLQVKSTMGSTRVSFIVDRFKYDESIVRLDGDSLVERAISVFGPRMAEDLGSADMPEEEIQANIQELTERLERER